MSLFYVAGPMTHGDRAYNLEQGIKVGMMIFDAGHQAFIPHLDFHLPTRPYEFWMYHDFRMIERCDGLVRIPGLSPGAEREVEFARRLGIEVYTVESLMIWLKENAIG